MLYTLRYQNDRKRCDELRQILKENVGISESKLAYIDCLLEYSGKTQRHGNLFQDGSVINNTKKFLNSMFGEDVKNVLL